MALFLPFQNGKNSLFTVETVAERNGPIFAKQALRVKATKKSPITSYNFGLSGEVCSHSLALSLSLN